MRRAPRARPSAILAALLVAGCAALGPRIEPPRVIIDDVRLDRIESVDAWFVASVTLTNPNPEDIAVSELDATLAIEGETVATAALKAPVTVPAHGTAAAQISAHTGVDALLRAVAAAMRRGASVRSSPALRYALSGRARLANGLLVPFRREGEVGAQPRNAS